MPKPGYAGKGRKEDPDDSAGCQGATALAMKKPLQTGSAGGKPGEYKRRFCPETYKAYHAYHNMLYYYALSNLLNFGEQLKATVASSANTWAENAKVNGLTWGQII
jgi:hypothetical protein